MMSTANSEYARTNFGVGAKWVKNLSKDRLGTFLDGRYGDVNLGSVLFTERIDDTEHVKLKGWNAPGRTKPSFQEAMKQHFVDISKGYAFGPSWTNHWVKVHLRIPSGWSKYERVQFEFDPSCEALIFDSSGTPLHGITGGHDQRRVEFVLSPEVRRKGTLDLVIEVSCNGMFGNGETVGSPDDNRWFNLNSADLVVPNQEAWRLMWDFNTLRQLADSLPGNHPLQNKGLIVANEIINIFRHDDPNSITKARKVAEQVFGEGWEKKGDKIYKEGHGVVQVWGIGHCHIDTAWLWPYSVTQQKVARSWATQVDLMERFPEHRFCASSAQQWKWLEQLYPKLFDRVKAKVLSGHFHPVGGSWVENDANMPSGEALARQLIFGQRFFQSRFGVRSKTGWLPDSFGFTGALPQIVREADMPYFFTQKISWNNINSFPHSTFNWVGIDGSQVLTHMTPVDTYTAQATVDDVKHAIENNKNQESSDKALLVFGNGDGGGGPLPPMLESLRRIRAAGNESRETLLPLVSMGSSVDEFYETVEKETHKGKKLPNWHGELYLEFHRGTYTSHGIIKKGNRKSEILLREIELVATLASLHKRSYSYPKDDIEGLWENLLLNQFHDVLPGSAIGMVYEDAEHIYEDIAKKGKRLIEEAIKVLIPSSIPISSEAEPVPKIEKGNIIAINTLHIPRREIVTVPLSGPAVPVSMLKSDVVQVSRDGKSGYAIVEAGSSSVVSVSGMFVDTLTSGAQAFKTQSGDFVLKNSNTELKISNGRIVSLYDVELDRELIPEGKDGGLVMYEDRPLYWDAWDVEWYHLQTGRPLRFDSIRIVETGPAYASIESTVKYDKSTIKVVISITSLPATQMTGSRSTIRFDTEVEWHQRHELLKFEIPLDIHHPTATFDTAFGNISRPTHRNTSLDLAKFEVCGHKYADLSEYGYGLAILSESKYGFAAEGNILRISLLRSATAPDPVQDQGYNSFSWALLPHAAHFYDSDVPLAAHIFNSPVHLRYAPEIVSVPAGFKAYLMHHGLITVEGATNVILETIKRGDDDDYSVSGKSKAPTVILRLYEAYGGHAKTQIRIDSRIVVKRAVLTNFLEDEKSELQLNSVPPLNRPAGSADEDTILNVNFRGFQVHTVKLTVAAHQDVSQLDGWVNILRV